MPTATEADPEPKSDLTGPDSDLEKAKLLWAEYEYRHAHCWRTIFQLTTAIVILSVIPYVHREVVAVLSWWMLTLAVLSILFAIFSLYVMKRELDVLQKVKDKYRSFQYSLFGIEHSGKSRSRWTFLAYLSCLLLLSLVNFWLVWRVWIPKNLPPP
jgi:hypothetical protein